MLISFHKEDNSDLLEAAPLDKMNNKVLITSLISCPSDVPASMCSFQLILCSLYKSCLTVNVVFLEGSKLGEIMDVKFG